MGTLNERLTEIRTNTARLKHFVMLLEKMAADLVEDAQAAGDMEVYRDAVLYQRAGHIAYDVLNLEPDLIDQELDQMAPLSKRSGSAVRYLLGSRIT